MWLLTIVFLVGGVQTTSAITVQAGDDYVGHACYDVMNASLVYASKHNVTILAATCGKIKEA